MTFAGLTLPRLPFSAAAFCIVLALAAPAVAQTQAASGNSGAGKNSFRPPRSVAAPAPYGCGIIPRTASCSHSFGRAVHADAPVTNTESAPYGARHHDRLDRERISRATGVW